MKTNDLYRSKLIKKWILVTLQIIIIVSTIILGQNTISQNEVVVITTNIASKKTAVVIGNKEEKIIKNERVVVFDNMTKEELANKLNRSLTNNLQGYGNTFANYAIQYGIDPYLAVAIVLHETGCKWNCSYLATSCNNIGGIKGYPSCGGSSYRAYATIDEGIKGFFDNLYNNFYAQGLTNVYSIHSKYAQDPNWALYITNYMNEIKSS